MNIIGFIINNMKVKNLGPSGITVYNKMFYQENHVKSQIYQSNEILYQ